MAYEFLIRDDYNEKTCFFSRISAFLTSEPGGESRNRFLDKNKCQS
jgi:hypothetical protein